MALSLQSTPGQIVVGVGDCRIAIPPDRSIATYALGSCLAITAWDWSSRVGGLLHVMMPDSSLKAPGPRAACNPFVYVDTGLPELLRRLEASGAAKRRLRWTIAGGASMMADSASLRIGKRNYLAVVNACWHIGIFIENEDVGGTESRSVKLDLSTGRVDVRTGAGTTQILTPAFNLHSREGLRR